MELPLKIEETIRIAWLAGCDITETMHVCSIQYQHLPVARYYTAKVIGRWFWFFDRGVARAQNNLSK